MDNKMKRMNNEEQAIIPMSEYKRLKTLDKQYSDNFNETDNVLVLQYAYIPTIANSGSQGVYICDKESAMNAAHEEIIRFEREIGRLNRENTDLRIKLIRARRRWWHF